MKKTIKLLSDKDVYRARRKVKFGFYNDDEVIFKHSFLYWRPPPKGCHINQNNFYLFSLKSSRQASLICDTVYSESVIVLCLLAVNLNRKLCLTVFNHSISVAEISKKFLF